MKRFFLVVLVGTVLCACSSKKQVAQHRVDRTEKEHIISYRDTTFVVPKKMAKLELAIDELRKSPERQEKPASKGPRVYESRNDNATARLILDGDSLRVEAECDSIALRAKIKNELIRENTFRKDTRTEETHTGVSGFEHWVSIIVAFAIGIVVGAIAKTFFI
jgi:hypothetical protein